MTAVFDTVGLTLRKVGDAGLPAGRFVELPGRGRTFAFEAGPPGEPDDVPTLMLVHGLVANAYLNWFPALPRLGERYRVVAMDLRGHGRGIRLRGRFRLEDCADDVVALADALGIRRFVPVGYSLGGPIAQLVWRRHRERVSGLVLAATSRNFGGTVHERSFFRLLPGIVTAIRLARRGGSDAADAETFEPFGDDGYHSRWALAELAHNSPQVMFQAMNVMGRYDSSDWVREIDVPTAVVITTKDRLVSPVRQLKLARAIEGATVHPASAGHAACVIGRRWFVPALVEACESVAARLAAGAEAAAAESA